MSLTLVFFPYPLFGLVNFPSRHETVFDLYHLEDNVARETNYVEHYNLNLYLISLF